MGNAGFIIGAIVVYLIVMLAIGFMFSKNNSNSSEFYLGDRKLGPLVAAMSAEASDMSSWLLMGLPGLAYLTGVCDPAWTAIGLAAGTWLNWLFVSRRLRRYSNNINAITIPEFFSKRYHDKKNILMFISAVVIIIFFVPYTASGFKAIGTLFDTLFNVDYHVALIIGAIVIVLYTVLGGFMAVSTTDLVQSIVMTIALVIIVFFGVSMAGGWNNVFENAKGLTGYLSMTSVHNMADNTSSSYGFLKIASALAWGLGYFGMPHILLRFMAIREERELKYSRRIATIWVVISMAVAVLIGIIGYGVTINGKIGDLTSSSAESETVIIKIAQLLADNGPLCAIIAGVVMAGILACTMSTADSQLLTASSSVSKNIIQDFFKIKLSDKVSMLIARGTVVVVALIGIFMAWNPESSVFKIVSFAWAGFGATFGATVLLALFWKRSNMWGALAGMVSGAVMVFVWKYAVRPIGGVLDIYELLPAFIVSFVFNVAVSLLTKAPESSVLKEFEEAKKK